MITRQVIVIKFTLFADIHARVYVSCLCCFLYILVNVFHVKAIHKDYVVIYLIVSSFNNYVSVHIHCDKVMSLSISRLFILM